MCSYVHEIEGGRGVKSRFADVLFREGSLQTIAEMRGWGLNIGINMPTSFKDDPLDQSIFRHCIDVICFIKKTFVQTYFSSVGC